MFDRATTTTATPTTVVNSAKLWSPWSFVVDVLLFLFSAIRRWQRAKGGEWGKWAKSNLAMLLANCSCALLLLTLASFVSLCRCLICNMFLKENSQNATVIGWLLLSQLLHSMLWSVGLGPEMALSENLNFDTLRLLDLLLTMYYWRPFVRDSKDLLHIVPKW